MLLAVVIGNRLTKDTDDYTYDDADQMTDVEGVTYGYDDSGNLTSRGASDTFAWDHQNRMSESVVGGVTTSYTYNGDGVRMSQTSGLTSVNYNVDVLAPLPVVVQDGTYSYVYGLDLISAIDGSANEIYYLYDGLGSVSEITDDVGVVTDTTTYDVFGGVRSSTGSTENVWLFTGEQSDGALGVEFIEAEVIDTVVSSTNLTGATVANLDEDPDAGDANWATATALGSTEARIGFPTPSAAPVTGADLQEFRVLLRKDAAAGTDPTYDIELWETGGGSALATLATGVTLTSEVGSVVSVTWDATLLGTADGSAVELRVVGTASVDRSVEVGAVEWNSQVPGTSADLYFLRARYYDPATGRFIGRDPIEFAQRYAYAGNNPVAFTDPSGLEYEGEGFSQCYGIEWGGVNPQAFGEADDILAGDWARLGAGCDEGSALYAPPELEILGNAVTYASLVPGPSSIPLLNVGLLPYTVGLDVASGAITQYHILRSSCSTDEKVGLSVVNGIDLGIGLAGQWLAVWASPTGVGSAALSVTTSAAEASLVLAVDRGLVHCE